MTQITIANIGNYPRIGEEKDQQRLRRALNHLQNKEISAHAFHDVEQSVMQEIVREQIIAGLDEVTHGHVTWHDSISYFCRKAPGIKLTGLSRFFDTNTYYRTPVIAKTPRKKPSGVLSDFLFAQSISNKPLRTVLTGPYTLARHTVGLKSPYKKISSRVDFFVDLIKNEIHHLVAQGAPLIQLDEPAIPTHPEDIVLFRKAMEKISGVIRPARFILNIYFSPLAPLYDQIRTLPVDILNLDFTYDGKKLLERLHHHPPSCVVGFGLLNGRNTRLEAIDTILRTLRNWIEKTGTPHLYLTPSCGLEHLPRSVAFEKLKLLKKIKDELVPDA